jgi:hypothetical protein
VRDYCRMLPTRTTSETTTPKEIAAGKARSDATAHRLSLIAFMAKYAHAMPIARNAAAGIAKTTMFAPLSHRPDEPDFI